MYLEAQEFEKAASLREKEKVLRHREEEMKREWEKTKGKGIQSVGEVDIEFIVSRWTGIPLSKLEEKESAKLARMEEALHGRIVGQDDAVAAVSRAIRRSRAGLKDAKRPVGSFVFLGPTGVGKTELARALAEYLFGDENALIRIDMSEYMEKFSVSRLVGAPPGYVGFEEGGQLTEKIRRRPYSVILFDEIEKAHMDVFNMLLQIMEEGKLTDSFGRHVDFQNTVLIMTSNIGASIIKTQSSLGFRQTSADRSYEVMKKELMEEVEKHFRPEFLNRLDDMIVFRALGKDDLKRIVEIEVRHVQSRLRDQGLEVTLTEDAKDFIIEKGYNPDFGARPIKRAIEQLIEDPLAEELLRGAFKEKAIVRIRVKDDHLYFDSSAPEPVEPVGAGAPVGAGVGVEPNGPSKPGSSKKGKK
jgi:ATP-dependent Clp protease ATP-binding subunit ClpC